MMQISRFLILAALAAATAHAQQNPLLGEDTVKVSDHVWAIMGFPNIAIIAGSRATLVVDTGLGPRNGATAARVAAKLSAPNAKLYLTTTHFHPEHAAGDAGFPAGTILVRNATQQQEMELHGKEMVEQFSRNARWTELLADVNLRTPDVIYNDEAKIDLGGVTARLLWFGGAHTKGDELIFVEPDRTLISGDVVQNKTTPNIFGDGGTPGSWLAVLDKVAALNALHVLPDHSAPGDGSLVAQEKAFIGDLRTRALALKKQGVTADDAGKQLSTELKAKYSDWPSMNVAGFVKSVYAE
ncbi:MAG: MBL fold metallo-hydrolase [Bryobacteraceae bacterium]|jgi:glyoxylase-like metal-dependent hydrolase (beta-lactamase superfamily II)